MRSARLRPSALLSNWPSWARHVGQRLEVVAAQAAPAGSDQPQHVLRRTAALQRLLDLCSGGFLDVASSLRPGQLAHPAAVQRVAGWDVDRQPRQRWLDTTT